MNGATTSVRRVGRRGLQVTVDLDGTRVATLLTVPDRVRTVIERAGPTVGSRLPGPEPATPQPASEAWPRDSADRAAHARSHDRHPAVHRARHLSVADGVTTPTTDILEAAGRALVDHGIRRLDVHLAGEGERADPWERAGWMAGRPGTDLQASLALRIPWRDPPGGEADDAGSSSPLPPGAGRLGRRLRQLDLAQVPELVHAGAIEVAGLVGQWRMPTRPGASAPPGTPPGTSPLAVTRFRTIRSAFDLVPDDLRSGGLVDVGAGDGRVLAEAVRAGFGPVSGYELDPDAADRARTLVSPAATVHVGDGLVPAIGPEVGVVFLNNPFRADGVERLGTQVAASLTSHPRPLLIIYINPPTITPLLNAGLRLVDQRPTFTVLATQGRGKEARC